MQVLGNIRNPNEVFCPILIWRQILAKWVPVYVRDKYKNLIDWVLSCQIVKNREFYLLQASYCTRNLWFKKGSFSFWSYLKHKLFTPPLPPPTFIQMHKELYSTPANLMNLKKLREWSQADHLRYQKDHKLVLISMHDNCSCNLVWQIH